MWNGTEYIYAKRTLKTIVENYDFIYQGIETRKGLILNSFSIAEYKADFDWALNRLGRGNWTGNIEHKKFNDFRGFGQLQRIVIADIYGVLDRELEALGFYQISQLRGRAYRWMKNHLNGMLPYGYETRFISKPS